MDPKKLDSKYGDYLRTLMLMKINNPNTIVPYIIRSGRIKRMKAKFYKFAKHPTYIVPK